MRKRSKPKDKCAAKLKVLRRTEREAQERSENKQLAAKMNELCKMHGEKPVFTEKNVGMGYKRFEKSVSQQAVAALSTATSVAMQHQCGYGGKRLYKLLNDVMARLHWISKGYRSYEQFDDELKADAKIDCRQFWKVTKYQDLVTTTVFSTMKYIFPVYFHAVFYSLYKDTLKRRSKRLPRIASEIVSVARDIVIEDKGKELRDELLKHRFMMYEDGRFGCHMSEQEFKIYREKYKKIFM